MDIHILHLIEGAKLARGITVIVDVFRAFARYNFNCLEFIQRMQSSL